MTRSEKAVAYFKEGYNCCQSIVLAFFDLVNIDKTELLKIASGFGGGLGRLRETCGAVSGMIIIAGLLYGYDVPDTDLLKKELYRTIQELGLSFEDKNGSLTCRDLLKSEEKHSNYIPSKRTKDFYDNRPCANLIFSAAEILEKYIENGK